MNKSFIHFGIAITLVLDLLLAPTQYSQYPVWLVPAIGFFLLAVFEPFGYKTRIKDLLSGGVPLKAWLIIYFFLGFSGPVYIAGRLMPHKIDKISLLIVWAVTFLLLLGWIFYYSLTRKNYVSEGTSSEELETAQATEA